MPERATISRGAGAPSKFGKLSIARRHGRLQEALTLDDFEALARERLPHMAYEFVASGAADEVTLRWNREAFQQIVLRPRVLRDVTSIDTTTSLLGEPLDFPILLAPVAYQKLMHADGEIAAARGAGRAGAIYVMSTAATCCVEDVAATGARLWMQIYLQSDREITRDLVERAESAGVRAICLTVDTPVLGTRNRQHRAGFTLPPELPTPHLDADGRSRLSVVSPTREPITWRDVDWLRSQTKGPILLKGILDPDDAKLALEHGAAGIIVSNHGARNLDTVPATIQALPAIADAVGGRCPLLLDGGIRRGTDVIKAVAFGASAVMVGRPYAFALAIEGADGVARAIAILREELETAMALLGRASIAEIDRSVIW
jgi:4-hydroxymandelate oxidase